MSDDTGPHRSKFMPELWAKWLERFNERPEPQLVEGIETMRALLAARDLLAEALEP